VILYIISIITIFYIPVIKVFNICFLFKRLYIDENFLYLKNFANLFLNLSLYLAMIWNIQNFIKFVFFLITFSTFGILLKKLTLVFKFSKEKEANKKKEEIKP